jgi:hypothetical protein
MVPVRLVTFATFVGIALVDSPQVGWAQRPEFEVASINPNKDNRGGSIVRTPGGLTATNAEFSRLIEMAFQTRLIDLSRVPDSLRYERFDIVAKAAGKISGDQYWEMLQTLLQDRFKLMYHRERKDAPLYATSALQQYLTAARCRAFIPSPCHECAPIDTECARFRTRRGAKHPDS